jgi:hypothetical protein
VITEDRGADGAAPDAPLAPVFDPGWRGRSMMLAALGAAILSRRAFRAAASGGDRTALEMQILAALALTEDGIPSRVQEGMSPAGIAWALAAEEDAVSVALARLARDGLVELPYEVGGEAEEDEAAEIGWVVSDGGRACVLAWAARIVPLFGSWPAAGAGAPDDAT